jgi:hypothetical protein
MTGTLTLDLDLDEPRARGDRRPRHNRAVAAPRARAPARAAATSALAPAPARTSDEPRTLDDLISGAWQELCAHHSVACPVCGGSMAPRYGSGARPVGGRCRRCGSALG